ncbi:hypothetical protein BSU04nite_19460 [Bacillus spizizenii]|nr:hypothetical protein BSU04nite_19460 [Bacillus spizizenii]
MLQKIFPCLYGENSVLAREIVDDRSDYDSLLSENFVHLSYRKGDQGNLFVKEGLTIQQKRWLTKHTKN